MAIDTACAIPLGSCCMGIPITLHYTFLLLWAAQVIFAIVQFDSFWYTLLMALLYGPVLLIAIVIHELGHAWMNKRFGGTADRIVLWPLGGYVVLGRTQGVSVMEDFWVALAGPLAHLPQIAAWFGIYCIFEPPDQYQFEADASWDFDELSTADGFLATLAEQAMFLNAGLLIFNLFIPAYPLDGGRILAALLVSCCCCSIRGAAITTSVVALALAAAMSLWAIYDLFIDNDDSADGGAPIILLLIAIWIVRDAVYLLRCGLQDRATDHVLFDKECYRKRAGGAEPSVDSFNVNNGMNNNNDALEEDAPMSRRERRAAAREAKRRAKEESTNPQQQQSSSTSNDYPQNKEDDETPRIGAVSGPVPEIELPPTPDDPVLSPAGAGTSWTTLNTVSQPPPPMMDSENTTSSKRGSSWFRRNKRPSQSYNDNDFVV